MFSRIAVISLAVLVTLSVTNLIDAKAEAIRSGK